MLYGRELHGRKKRKQKLPKGFKPQFEGSKTSPGRKAYLKRLAKRNTWWASKFPKVEAPIKRYTLSDKPLNYTRYLLEPYWRTLRTEIIESRKSCEVCGRTSQLNVHHKYYYDTQGKSVLYRERSYPDLLQLLCEKCHAKEHGLEEFGW